MKLRRVQAIALKEVLQVRRDPISLTIALLMPFIQMFLLGYGVSLDVKHLPVCIFDREASVWTSHNGALGPWTVRPNDARARQGSMATSTSVGASTRTRSAGATATRNPRDPPFT